MKYCKIVSKEEYNSANKRMKRNARVDDLLEEISKTNFKIVEVDYVSLGYKNTKTLHKTLKARIRSDKLPYRVGIMDHATRLFIINIET